VDGIFGFTVSTGQHGNPRLGNADCAGKVDGVLHDIHLRLEVRGDVDGGIGDEQGMVEAGHVHDKDVG